MRSTFLACGRAAVTQVFRPLAKGELSMKLTFVNGIVMALTTAVLPCQMQQDFHSAWYAVGLSRNSPAFTSFSVNSLGQGKLQDNPVLKEPLVTAGIEFWRSRRAPSNARKSPGGQTASVWQIDCAEKVITLRAGIRHRRGNAAARAGLQSKSQSRHAAGSDEAGRSAGCLALRDAFAGYGIHADHVQCRFLGAGVRRPAIQRLRSEFRFQAVGAGAVCSRDLSASYGEASAGGISPGSGRHFSRLPGIEADPRFDGFRRDYLNVFQVNPRMQLLANNASSNAVAFAVYVYSDMAMSAPPLAEGLTCQDLVRMTVDRYLSGAKGYGMVGYRDIPEVDIGEGWTTPYNALEPFPRC